MDDVWMIIFASMGLLAFVVIMTLCAVKCMYTMNNNNRTGQNQAEMVVVVA